jgi:hypothetical protein
MIKILLLLLLFVTPVSACLTPTDLPKAHLIPQKELLRLVVIDQIGEYTPPDYFVSNDNCEGMEQNSYQGVYKILTYVILFLYIGALYRLRDRFAYYSYS